MYNLSKKFETFYNDYTVLPKPIQSDLRDKKKLNLDRLEAGLEDYNDEKDTDYKVSETKEQGSIAMHTIVQNDSNDYDIDVAVIFDEDNIGENTGTTTIKHIVANALKRKCSSFKKEPELKTNCVRIEYCDGYHVDFAVYKKNSSGTYYHAGSEWHERDPMSINNWFGDAIKEKGEKLRKVVRFSKMFCKSHDNWNMPGGLIQSVLCEECFADYERLDECFYYTMINIRDRLIESIDVYNPTDSSKSLLLTESDKTKMNNWKTRLNDKLSGFDIIFKSECSEKQAYDSWYTFFNHDFWIYEDTVQENRYSNVSKVFTIFDYFEKEQKTEQFITSSFAIASHLHKLTIECWVEPINNRSGKAQKLSYMVKNNIPLHTGRSLTFKIITDSLQIDIENCNIFWKVKNNGIKAYNYGFRGEIIETNKTTHYEYSSFAGNHYVECYIVKKGRCIAKGRINVPIEE